MLQSYLLHVSVQSYLTCYMQEIASNLISFALVCSEDCWSHIKKRKKKKLEPGKNRNQENPLRNFLARSSPGLQGPDKCHPFPHHQPKWSGNGTCSGSALLPCVASGPRGHPNIFVLPLAQEHLQFPSLQPRQPWKGTQPWFKNSAKWKSSPISYFALSKISDSYLIQLHWRSLNPFIFSSHSFLHGCHLKPKVLP